MNLSDVLILDMARDAIVCWYYCQRAILAETGKAELIDMAAGRAEMIVVGSAAINGLDLKNVTAFLDDLAGSSELDDGKDREAEALAEAEAEAEAQEDALTWVAEIDPILRNQIQQILSDPEAMDPMLSIAPDIVSAYEIIEEAMEQRAPMAQCLDELEALVVKPNTNRKAWLAPLMPQSGKYTM